jgi:hypothetical protein
METASTSYGLMAEFEKPDELLEATRRTFSTGYRKIDAYSPMPIHGLAQALGFEQTRLPFLVFAGGVIGAIVGYGLCYWVSVLAYPLNVGGRPLHSGPAFIPVTFEITILFAALAAVFGMIIANGLPMPYHPVFNVPGFSRASQDRFFLCIEADDPQFDQDGTKRFLESLNPHEVSEIDR